MSHLEYTAHLFLLSCVYFASVISSLTLQIIGAPVQPAYVLVENSQDLSFSLCAPPVLRLFLRML